MSHDSHDLLELAATAPLKTDVRPVRVSQNIAITESWNLKIQFDGAGEPDNDDWQTEATDSAITAKEIQAALAAAFPNRKFEVEQIEVTEIDV